MYTFLPAVSQFQNIGMKNMQASRKHTYIISTLLNSILYSKTGVYKGYIIFLISAQKIDCGYSLEPPRQSGSNEYPQSMFWAEI